MAMYFWLCPECGISVYEDYLKCNCGYITTREEVEKNKVTFDELEKRNEERRQRLKSEKSSMNITHYYELLGLKPGASEEEIKQAYRDLSMVWHPDRFARDPRLQKKAEEKMKEINEAYQKLQDYLKDSQFFKTESEQSTQSKGSSQSDTGASKDRVRDNAQSPPEPPKETTHPDESSRQRDIQLKDNISYKYLPFIFAVFIGGTCYNLFSTSSRIDNAIIGGISGGLGATIGYGITKGINSLKVSKGKKVVIAWMVGIIGLFILSSIPVLLFNTKSKDTLDINSYPAPAPETAPDQAPIINEVISDEEIKQAKNLLNNKDWQGLLNLSQQLIRLHPNDGNSWSYLGVAYYYLQQYDQAIQAFNEALRIMPNDYILYFNRGNAYLGNSQFDMAIADYGKTIAINPNLSIAYLGRGYSYYNKSDYKRALSDFQKACKMGDKSACESLKDVKQKQESDYYQRKLESESVKNPLRTPNAETSRINLSGVMNNQRFIIDSLTIKDTVTGLTWLREPYTDRDVTYEGAQQLIKQINNDNFANSNNWRLPSKNELQQFAKYVRCESNVYKYYYFWTHDYSRSGLEGVWCVDLCKGEVAVDLVSQSNNVWPVYSAQ